MDTIAPSSGITTRIASILLTALGVLGLMATTSQDTIGAVLGTFEVSFTASIVHLVLGVVGIGSVFLGVGLPARTWTLVAGIVLAVVGVVGMFATGIDLFGMTQEANAATAVLQIVFGALLLLAWRSADEAAHTA